jgi:hypothetical protein
MLLSTFPDYQPSVSSILGNHDVQMRFSQRRPTSPTFRLQCRPSANCPQCRDEEECPSESHQIPYKFELHPLARAANPATAACGKVLEGQQPVRANFIPGNGPASEVRAYDAMQASHFGTLMSVDAKLKLTPSCLRASDNPLI